MGEQKTELVFLLDRSGSMQGLEDDTIGGFNGMLAQQRADISTQVRVTTVLFDDRFEILHDRLDLTGVAPLDRSSYYVRGRTALYDAIGLAIQKIESVQRNTVDSEQAQRVLFVITTDGQENASNAFTRKAIQSIIEDKRTTKGWEFIFLGANIDAETTAEELGMDRRRAVTYLSDKEGTSLNYATVNGVVSSFRRKAPIPEGWKDDIEADVIRRRRRS